MKKAKIFLTALTVLAVVGGALAFKIKTPHVFASCDIVSLKCVINPFTTFLKTTDSGGFIISYAEYGRPCVWDPTKGWACTARVTESE